MLDHFRDIVAGLISPRLRNEHRRLVDGLYEAQDVLGYEYPSIAMLTRWVLRQSLDTPELAKALRQTVGFDEPMELSKRAQLALNDARELELRRLRKELERLKRKSR